MTKALILVCGLLLGAYQIGAQSTTGSAYNIFGIGSLSANGLESFLSKGNAGIGSRSPQEVNLKNPASLNSIVGASHIFDLGLSFSSVNQRVGGEAERLSLGGLSNVNVWLRVGKKTAIAFGLSPFSDSKYDITDEYRISDLGDFYTLQFTGSGGLNRYYLAASQHIFKGLNVGMRASIISGKVASNQYITNNSIFGNILISSEEYVLRGIVDFGLQYYLKLNENSSLGFGVTYQPSFTVNTDKEQHIISGFSDSLTSVSQGQFEFPEMYGVGISYQSKSWMISADVEIEEWSGNSGGESFEYQNRLKNSVGVEFCKDPVSYLYLNRVIWRAGVAFDNYYLNFDQGSITNMSISGGVGLPIQGRLGLINLGYSYGRIQPNSEQLIQESTHKLMLNISIRDRWFQKRRYD